MWPYAIKRVLGAIPTLFIIVTLTFFMMRIAPGGPFDAQRHLPPEIEHNIRAAYNLDKPLSQQYLMYLDRLIHGDLGPSYKNHDFTVTELIAEGLPVSAKLGITALLLAIVGGILLGAIAALYQNSMIDYGVMAIAMIGITIPTFVTAPVLALVFGIYGIHIFGYDFFLPAGGWNGGAIANMVLPVIVLALPQVAVIARLMRGSMIEVMRSNYVRTARAKGLPNYQIIFRHVQRAALLPVVSYLGPAIAGLLTGSLVVETMFGIPGIGRYFVEGAINRDYTLVMGVVACYGALVILLNLAADMVYALLDPRVRLN
jgi:oligopeptide transport system permease protein